VPRRELLHCDAGCFPGASLILLPEAWRRARRAAALFPPGLMKSSPARDSIAYRPATPEDRAFLRYVYATTREAELQRVPWSDEQKAAFVDMQFQSQTRHYEDFYPTCEFLIIEVEGRPAGRLYIDRRETEADLIDIALIPE